MEFRDVGSNGFVVMWRAPEGQLSGYRVLVTPKNNNAAPKELIVAPDSTQVIVTDLLVNNNN